MAQQSIQRADALAPGSQLHVYIVLKVLGSGAFGITYLAEHIHLGSQHVIKEYLPDSGVRVEGLTVQAKSSSDQEIFNWGLNGFFNEAKLLYGLNHPNIVKVTDLFEANGTAYFVMPYLSGITLHQWIKDHPHAGEAELQSIFIPLLEGLKYIHERQLLHRDIKPENIFITENQTPVLIDFGAARQAVGQKSRPLTQILTPPFAPIEQYHSRDVFMPALDLYSLGACIYQAVAHRLIEEAPARIAGEDTQPKLAGSEYEKQYSHAFLAAVDYALNVRAENRFQSAMDMQQALLGQKELPPPIQAAPAYSAAPATQAAYNGATAVYGAPQAAAAAPAPRAKNKLLLWGGIGGAAAVLIAVIAVFAFGGKEQEPADEPAQTASAVQTAAPANDPIVLPPADNGGSLPGEQPEQPQQPMPVGGNSNTAQIAAQVEKMNRELPKSLGDGVRWEKVLYVEASNTMIMQLTLTKLRQRDLSNAQLEQIKSALGPEMAKTSCQDPNVAPWLTSGGTLLIAFYDRNNKHLVDASISGADCRQ